MKIVADESQFVVLQSGDHVSIRMDQLQEQVAPIAKTPDYINGIGGTPGLMYPGEGISYKENTGEISVDIPRVPQFLGIVGDEDGMIKVPTGKEIYDDYYVVGVPGYTLPNSWGELYPDVTPNIGDKIVCGDEDKGQDRWYIEPDLMGEFAVLEVKSSTTALVVDSTDHQRLVLSISDAVAKEEGMTPGHSGLLNGEDKMIIDNLGDVYLMRSFADYPPVP